MRIDLDLILRATGGKVAVKGTATFFDSFHIDSRKTGPGSLFFAMKGTQTDGHLFLNDAASRGAGGAVVEKVIENVPITQIQVADTLKALYDLAACIRKNQAGKYVGITGSSGKTSTKEFTAALLSHRYRVFRSEGNLNSTTGLPLSLLSMMPAECSVFEIGMNRPGEIAALSRLLTPDVAVILNVNPVHIGQFPSLEAIADEKASMAEGVALQGTVVYNYDDPALVVRLRNTPHRQKTYGFSPGADLQISGFTSKGVHGSEAEFRWQGERLLFQTKLSGRGHIYNISAAVLVAFSLGLTWNEVRPAVEALQPYHQRGVLIPCNDITFYDDSYNSNPIALQMVLEAVAATQGYLRKVAILGDMLELGLQEENFHRQAGRQVADNGFDLLITAGPLSRFLAEGARDAGMKNVYTAGNSFEAAELATRLLQPGDLVLLKGSRGMKMETVLQPFTTLSKRE